MADWTQAYSRALGVKWTPEVASRLNQWQVWEGGATKNNATYNYLNTSESMPGSTPMNSSGIQAYKTLAQGAMAFAKTLKGNPNYAGLTQWLATGKGDPSGGLQTWVSGKSDGNPAYAAKVLGTHVGAGSSNGRMSGSDPGDGGSTPSPAVDLTGESVDPMTAVRSTAAEGFAAIAQGREKPQDAFTNLLGTLKAMKVSTPQVAIPTPQQGGSSVEQQAANLVHKYLGVAYRWGGAAPTGFDCSGLLQYVWKSLGVSIPRTTFAQFRAGKPVDLASLKPGDAVFAAGSDGTPDNPGHVGMYIGGGKIIAAPHTGTVVQVQNLADWNVVGARRFA